MRGVVAPQRVLARRARRDQPDAQLGELRRDLLERLQQRVERLLQAPGWPPAPSRAGRAGRAGARRCPPGHRAAAAAPPTASARRPPAPALPPAGPPARGSRPPPRRRRAPTARRGAPAPRRALGRAASAVGGARVRPQPPRLARRLVDRAAHDRMAERVAPRHRGRAQHVARHQLLQRRQRLLLAQPGGGGGEVEVRRVARDGRAPRQPPRALAQALDLLPERGGHRGRHADHRVVERLPHRPLRTPRQLLQVERVAAALAVDLLADGRRQLARP